MSKLRYLTKSRFKLAVECPTKIFYSGKSEYADLSTDDSFLAALAEGGYQVGALARVMYSDGVLVDDVGLEDALRRTSQLLRQENITIFEAAICVGGSVARIDILKKCGKRIELIEVKSKSYSLETDGDFRDRVGSLAKKWRPYLQDVAFQTFLAQRALPETEIHPYLLLADKTKAASIDGLNQLFKVIRSGGRSFIQTRGELRASDLGNPLLIKINVGEQVEEILSGTLTNADGVSAPFPDAIRIQEAYRGVHAQGRARKDFLRPF